MKTKYGMWGGRGFIGASILDEGDFAVEHGSRLSLPGERLPEEWSGVIWSAGFPGIKNVDDVERNPIRSKLQNVWEPAEVAMRCQEQGKRLLLIASGCIFDRLNAQGKPHTETDEPNFVCTVYLRDQKEKEERVAAACPGVTIFRIRVPFNGQHNPRNTLHKLAQFASVWDIEQSYTWTEDLKRAIAAWKEGAIDGGIWHVTQPGTLSNYEMVRKYLNPKVGRITGDVHKHEKMLCPRSAAILDCSKLAKVITLTPAEEAFARSAKAYLAA
jgi:dTDP-4-dehydrorhamnose reductase